MSVQIFEPTLAEQYPHSSSRKSGSFGIYIHVPFCVRKCSYCSFYSVPGGSKWFNQYVAAVRRQIQEQARTSWCREHWAESVFFGGGTPTVLEPEQLVLLLRECRQLSGRHLFDTEISIEVNPATIDYEGLVLLRQGGFNRVSIGIQSLNDRELERLGRVHTAEEARQTVSMAREAGFDNLSLDLMYGLPGQDLDSWTQTLDKALTLAPDHLAIYELTLEEGTSFFDRAGQGDLDLPDEEEVLAMLGQTGLALKEVSLQRYEISNYARPGFECLHNVNYWNNGSYLGFGPSAVSYSSRRRMTTLADMEQFCLKVQKGESVIEEIEELNREQRFRETVVMGLRMTSGVSVGELQQRFGINLTSYYGETLNLLVKQGLVEMAKGRLHLTEQGMLLANTVMSELV